MRSAGERRFESGAVLRDLPPCAISTTPRASPCGATVTSDGLRSGKAAAMLPVGVERM